MFTVFYHLSHSSHRNVDTITVFYQLSHTSYHNVETIINHHTANITMLILSLCSINYHTPVIMVIILISHTNVSDVFSKKVAQFSTSKHMIVTLVGTVS